MDISPLAFMNFDSGPKVDGYQRITPLMSNPGVYEMHQTEIFNSYGEVIDSHISCYDNCGDKMWQHTIHK